MSFSVTNSHPNYAACATVSLLAVATVASTSAAVTATSTVAAAAFALLAVVLAAVSGASIFAWLRNDTKTVKQFFDYTINYSGVAIAGSLQFVSQTLLQALLQGVAQGISRAISRKIAGPDHTSEVTHKRL